MRKRERDTGRETLQVLYLFSVSLPFVPPSSLLCPPLLLTFLLLFRFYFYWSHVFFLCLAPPFHPTSNNPQVFIWSCFGTTARSHGDTRETHRNTLSEGVASRKKCRLAGKMNQGEGKGGGTGEGGKERKNEGRRKRGRKNRRDEEVWWKKTRWQREETHRDTKTK